METAQQLTHTTFLNKPDFLLQVQQTNEKLKNLLGKIQIALSDQGFPLKKDSYHFLTRVLKPTTRVERTVYSLLFQAAYQSEIMSSGSSYIATQFAMGFIEELLKNSDFSGRNEVELAKEFEETLERYRNMLRHVHQTVTAQDLTKYVVETCDDPLLAQVLGEALITSGLEGKIHIEDGQQDNYLVEQKSGYSFQSLKPFKFMLPKNGSPWEASNVRVLLVDGILERVSELDKILNGAMNEKAPVLIIAHGFSEEIAATIKVNVDAGKLNVMPVRLSPELDSLNVINDIAVVCGSDVISTLKGQMVVFTEFSSLPIVERVRLNLKELSIEHGKTRAAVSQHLRMLLEKRLAQHAVEDISDLIDRRIQTLISAAVTIRLPSMPAAKRDSTKVKIDIALRNAKTLVNYGHASFTNLTNWFVPQTKMDAIFHKALKFTEANLVSTDSKKATPLKMVPALSAYVGVYFAGKTVLNLMTTGGLVEITEIIPVQQVETEATPEQEPADLP